MLTVKQVQTAPPGRHSDGRGLYLLVKPSGARSWVLRVQHCGRRRDFGLGSIAPEPIDVDLPIERRSNLTLSEAREKARIGRELAKAGLDPSREWKKSARVVPTFKNAAKEYHTHVSKTWRNGKHGHQWIRTLEKYAFPSIGDLPVDEIDAPAIQAALLPIWLTIPETARRVRQRIGVVLDYSKGKGWRDTETPLRALSHLLGGIKQPRSRNFAAMPYVDLPDFMSRLRVGEPAMGKLALQFLILTAARSGEVRNATWDEIDLVAGEWRIPARRMKAGKIHIVPLAPAAIETLNTLHTTQGEAAGQIIFPGLKGKALSDATLTRALRAAGAQSCTVHGFRSAFRDWAADEGFADSWAEAALAHGTPDKTEAAYKRTTFYTQRRDHLMPAWEAFLFRGQVERDSGR